MAGSYNPPREILFPPASTAAEEIDLKQLALDRLWHAMNHPHLYRVKDSSGRLVDPSIEQIQSQVARELFPHRPALLQPRHKQPVGRNPPSNPHVVLKQIIRHDPVHGTAPPSAASLISPDNELDERTLPKGKKPIPSPIRQEPAPLRSAGFNEDEIRRYLGLPTSKDQVEMAIAAKVAKQEQNRPTDFPVESPALLAACNPPRHVPYIPWLRKVLPFASQAKAHDIVFVTYPTFIHVV